MRSQTNWAGQALRAAAAAASVVVACTANFASADTLTLRDGLVDEFNFFPGAGYAGTADESLSYNSTAIGGAGSGTDGSNNHWMRTSTGAATTFRFRAGGSHTRVLLRFDLGALAAEGVTVNSATIRWVQNSAAGVNGTASLYQVAPANAGWAEGTGNTLTPSSTNVTTSSGDATFWYKSVVPSPGGNVALPGDDTASVRWASGLAGVGSAGSSPGVAQGGLFNVTDLVDANPATPATNTTLGNLDPIVTAAMSSSATANTPLNFNIPVGMLAKIQSWIDAPADNAGLLGTNSVTTAVDWKSSENATLAQRPTLILDITTHRTLHWDVDGAATPGAGGATPAGTWDNTTLNFNTDSTGGGGGRVSGLVTSGDTVVFSAGADATGAYTVTLPAARSAAKIVFNQGAVTLTGGSLAVGTVEAASGIEGVIESTLTGGALIKTGDGTVRLSAANTHTGGTTVSAGKLVLGNAGATAGGALNVADGAVAQAQAGLAKAVTVSTLATNASGRFDVTNNSIVIKGMADSAVRTQLQAGYNAGAWNGPTGIVSSSITSETSIGYATQAQTGITDFKGVTGLAAGDVLVKFTYAGDANLDGKVDIGDLGLLAGAWQATSGKVWFDGDFTYDGAVDIGDLGLLSGNWQKGTDGNPSPPLMDFSTAMAQFSAFDGVVVPEPAGLSVLAFGGLAISRRRRARRLAEAATAN